MRPEVLARIRESKNGIMRLAQMGIHDGEIQEIIAEIQKVNPHVSTIDLDGNNIGDKGAVTLKDCLQSFSDIKELSLQFNEIGKEGAIGLFSLKKDHHHLDILFHGNKITNVKEMNDIEHLARGESLISGRP